MWVLFFTILREAFHRQGEWQPAIWTLRLAIDIAPEGFDSARFATLLTHAGKSKHPLINLHSNGSQLLGIPIALVRKGLKFPYTIPIKQVRTEQKEIGHGRNIVHLRPHQ